MGFIHGPDLSMGNDEIGSRLRLRNRPDGDDEYGNKPFDSQDLVLGRAAVS
jgi:hypothetical protein